MVIGESLDIFPSRSIEWLIEAHYLRSQVHMAGDYEYWPVREDKKDPVSYVWKLIGRFVYEKGSSETNKIVAPWPRH